MLTKRFYSTVLSLVCLAALSACGFQLRGTGSDQGGMPFKSIHVAASDSSHFAGALKRYIAATRTDVTSAPREAEAIVEVLKESRDRSILTRNSQGRVREYNLEYTLQFRVKDNRNAVLLPTSELSLRRTLSFNESAVLAKEAEETRLYRDMENDMVQQVVRRMMAIKPQAAESGPAPSAASVK